MSPDTCHLALFLHQWYSLTFYLSCNSVITPLFRHLQIIPCLVLHCHVITTFPCHVICVIPCHVIVIISCHVIGVISFHVLGVISCHVQCHTVSLCICQIILILTYLVINMLPLDLKLHSCLVLVVILCCYYPIAKLSPASADSELSITLHSSNQTPTHPWK